MKENNLQTHFLDDQFKSNLMLAIGIHLAFIIIFFLFSRQILNVISKTDTSDLELIKASVKVDVVAMPKFTIQELKKLDDVPKVEEEASKKEVEPVAVQNEVAPVINKDDLVQEKLEKVKKKKLSSLLSSYSKKEISKNKKDGENGIVLAGNKLSKGTALVGESSDAASSEFAGYVGELPDQIRKFWKIPGYLREQNLKCRIRLFLGLRGQVIKSEVFESSGVQEYDERAMAAISQAGPFSAPSSDVAKRLLSQGIILGFPL
jgi:colicin import membrane protein